jgi:hypothetical protein
MDPHAQPPVVTARQGIAGAVWRSALGRARLFAGNREPSLKDVMSDPIVRRLLASDNVAVDHMQRLIAEMQGRLARHPPKGDDEPPIA